MNEPEISKFFADLKIEKEDKGELFSQQEWILNASKTAHKLSIASHPCTFTHPKAKGNAKTKATTHVLALAHIANDGLLRHGNVIVEKDVMADARDLRVCKFLMLKMSDSRTLLEHLLADSDVAVTIFSIVSSTYETVKKDILKIIKNNNPQEQITSSKIKQVYFPVENDYHLLSLLSSSGLMHAMNERIKFAHFSDQTKESKKHKKEGTFSEYGFSTFANLTCIGYGGSKPQNISYLNNRIGKNAYLLQSIPPTFSASDIRFPQKSFFVETLRSFDFKDEFRALHKLFVLDYNNKNIRDGIRFHLEAIIDKIVEKMWKVRSVAPNSFDRETSKLNAEQTMWLCAVLPENGSLESDFLDSISEKITLWIILAYEKNMGKKTLKLGEEERKSIAKVVMANKEAFQ